MRCSKCGTENAPSKKFCSNCGGGLENRCPKCGAQNSPQSRFCGDCGAALTTNTTASPVPSSGTASISPTVRIAADQPEASSAPDGERKTVTALFADIKGSMDLMEDIDPEEARSIVDPALKLMIDAAHRYGGHIVQSTGDGIFAMFGAPIAHEDHPNRALFSALRMQEDVKRYAAKLRAEKGVNLQVRVGVNTGEVVVRSIKTDEAHTEYTPIGHSTSLASRLQTLATPGSIAISETVRKLVEGYFALKSLGPARIKGVSEPVNVYEVTGLGPLRTRLQRSAGRGLTKFVGRAREIDAMRAAADQAKAGHGQIVAAIAEAGIGKSRLFFEFKARMSSEWMVLEALSVSHGKATAYLPVIDLLSSYFKISDDDDDRSRREKVAGRLAILDPSLESTRPYLFTLLGIAEGDEHARHWEQTLDRLDEYLHKAQKKDPLAQMDSQIRRRRTLDAIKRILLRESLNQPLMLVFEDLHWIDEETQALLDLLADSIGTSRVLMLLNYRPEYSHAWTNKTYYTQVRLDPLGRESAENMLSALVGEEAILKPLRDLIVQKTEGNPFFMEEIVQGLLEDGALARNGTTTLTRPLDTLKIPATVQAMLASRIDRLPATEKDLLQTLAVLGKDFGLGLISAVTSKSDDELTATLSNLQLAEFIYERPALPDMEYTFKHALTHDVAYNSVLIERRKLVHERAGAAMETLYSERLDDHLSAIADQYRQSHNARKAIHYLRLAGAQAAQRSANRESVAYLREALDLLRSLPGTLERKREELDLLLMLGPATMTLAGYGAARELYGRAKNLCGELGDNTKLFPVLWGLWMSHASRGELSEARKLAVELLSVAEGLGIDMLRLEAHHAMWNTLMYLGELRGCLLQAERGAAFYDPRQHAALVSMYGGHDPGICGKNHAAQVLWHLGYPDRALKCTSEALALAHELAHPNSLAQALLRAAMNDHARRDRAITAKHAELAIAISVEHGFAQWVTMGTILRIWAENDPTTRERDRAKMREALAEWRAPGDRFFLPYFLSMAAEVCSELKSVDEALELVTEALDLVDRTGERWYEAELHRLSGELLWLRDSSSVSAVERRFRTAIEVARKQEAKSLELRATTSLARILRETSRHDEARTTLSEIYNWFTEGFDTADLKDASALLDSLNK